MKPDASGNYFEFAIDMMVSTHPLAEKVRGVVAGIHGCVRLVLVCFARKFYWLMLANSLSFRCAMKGDGQGQTCF